MVRRLANLNITTYTCTRFVCLRRRLDWLDIFNYSNFRGFYMYIKGTTYKDGDGDIENTLMSLLKTTYEDIVTTGDQWLVHMDTPGDILIVPPGSCTVVGACESALCVRWGFGLCSEAQMRATYRLTQALINRWGDLDNCRNQSLLKHINKFVFGAPIVNLTG